MDNLTVAMTREYVEVLEMLKLIPREDFLKIPKEKIQLYEKYKDRNYKFKINPNIDLASQNISRGAYAIFVNLYKEYIATPEEKSNVENRLQSNETKKKASVIKSNENIQIEEVDKPLENVAIVETKDSFVKKIINKIKTFFHMGEVN